MTSTQAQQLNATLRQDLIIGFKTIRRALAVQNDLPPEVASILNTIQQSDLADYSASIAGAIAGQAIPSWQKEFAAHPGALPQLLFFEWNDNDYQQIEALSYGIIGLTETTTGELPLFEDPGWNYDFFHNIEADYGFDFYFFELLEQYLPYEKFGDALDDESTPLGFAYDQLRQLMPLLNELLTHDAFAALDRSGAFDPLGLPVGFPFSLGVHDGGNLIRPFYVKG